MLNAQNVEVWERLKFDFQNGEICSLGQWTIQNLLKDISTNILSNVVDDYETVVETLGNKYNPEFDVYCKIASINYGLLLVYIYGQSIIDIESHYKISAMLSYKTSTSENELAELPYWRFHNYGVYIEEILKQENGESGGAGSESEQVQNTQANIQSSTKNMMNNMKSSVGSFKTPKLK